MTSYFLLLPLAEAILSKSVVTREQCSGKKKKKKVVRTRNKLIEPNPTGRISCLLFSYQKRGKLLGNLGVDLD